MTALGWVIITLACIATAFMVHAFVSAPVGFEHPDHGWLPGTPEEWGITPDEAGE